MKNIILIVLITVTSSAFASEHSESWTPVVTFSLEGGTYENTLHWISGWSYALTEMGKASAKAKNGGHFCLPEQGYIGSRALLDILNREYKGMRITSEAASESLWAGVMTRYKCNE